MKKLKDFFRMFNIFELNLNARSYKSAFIRMAVSIAILFGVCAFRFNVTITDVTVNIFLTIFILAIMVMCVLCFFIAAVESLQVGDNRKKDKERDESMKKYK